MKMPKLTMYTQKGNLCALELHWEGRETKRKRGIRGSEGIIEICEDGKELEWVGPLVSHDNGRHGWIISNKP
jgi:hypothetical protein